MRNSLATVCMTACAVFLSTTGHAEIITWTDGGATNSWHDPDNWDLPHVPNPVDDVVLGDIGQAYSARLYEQVVTVNSVTVSQTNATLLIDVPGALYVTTDVVNHGTIIIDSAGIHPTGNIENYGAISVSSGPLDFGVLECYELQNNVGGTVDIIQGDIFLGPFLEGGVVNDGELSFHGRVLFNLDFGGSETFTNNGIVHCRANQYGGELTILLPHPMNFDNTGTFSFDPGYVFEQCCNNPPWWQLQLLGRGSNGVIEGQCTFESAAVQVDIGAVIRPDLLLQPPNDYVASMETLYLGVGTGLGSGALELQIRGAPGSLEVGLIKTQTAKIQYGELKIVFVDNVNLSFGDRVTALVYEWRGNPPEEFPTISYVNTGNILFDLEYDVVIDPKIPLYKLELITRVDCNNNGVIDPDERIDSDGNGISDACDHAAEEQLIEVRDGADVVQETFFYDQGRRDEWKRGDVANPVATKSYTYDGEGKLETVTSTAFDGTPPRAYTVIYDEFDRVIGTSSAGCGCGTAGTFTYVDEQDRVYKVTVADPLDPVNATVLETVLYVENDDRLKEHWRRSSQGDMELVESREYIDSPSNESYVANISMPVDASLEQRRQESYDEHGRLVSIGEYEELAVIGSPFAAPDFVTQYTFSATTDSSGRVISETREVISPLGVRSVNEWSYTGVPFEVGSTKVALSYLTDAPGGPQKNLTVATDEYDDALGDYRLSNVVGPNGGVTDYEYDPLFPGRVRFIRKSNFGGLIPGPDILEVEFGYDPAGHVSTNTQRPGPHGLDVITAQTYDTLGRMTSRTADAGGLQRLTEFRYNAFDELIAERDPAMLVAATIRDDDGRTVEQYVCEFTGDFSTFDPLNPPADSVFRHTTTTYHSVSGTEEINSIALADEVPFTKDTTAFADAVSTFDATGQWLLTSAQPGAPPPTTAFTYDRQQRTISVTSPEGTVAATVYNGHGSVGQTIIGDGVVDYLTTTYDYNDDGRTELIANPDGTFVRSVYDSFGRLTTEKRCDTADCTGTTTEGHNEYNDAGQVTRRYMQDLEDTLTDYDNFGRPYLARHRIEFGVTDDDDSDGAADRVRLTEYDVSGVVQRTAIKKDANPAAITPYVDRVVQFSYNALGQVETETRQNVNQAGNSDEVIDYAYDPAGRRTHRTIDPAELAITTVTEYNTAGQVTKQIDGEEHYVVFAYDSRGNLIRSTSFEVDGANEIPRQQARRQFDLTGNLEEQVVMADAAALPATLPNNAVDRVTKYTYDLDGRRLTGVTFNMNNGVTELVTTFSYDDIGRLTTTTDPIGSTLTTVYEELSPPPTGRIDYVEFTDIPGRPRKIFYDYDLLSRLKTLTDIGEGLGTPKVTSFTYDDADRKLTTTQSETAGSNIVTRQEYDLLGRPDSLIEADGSGEDRITESDYNRFDDLVALRAFDDTPQPAVEQTTSYVSDLFGRRIFVTYPELNDEVEFVYDKASRPVTKIDQRGVVTVNLFDDRGLLINRMATSTTAVTSDTYDRDGLGRVIRAERIEDAVLHIATVTRDYSDLSDMEYETQLLFDAAAPKTFEYTYDQAGNRLSMDCTAPEVVCLTYDAYDSLNRLGRIDRDGVGLVDYFYTGRYLDYRRVRTTGAVETYVEFDPRFDEHRRIDQIINRKDRNGNTTILNQFEYTLFDLLDKRTNVAATGSSVHTYDITYDYDKLQRLTSADYGTPGIETFDMDSLGNRTSYVDTRGAGQTITYADNNLTNEYSSIDTEPVVYDDAGNLTEDPRDLRLAYDFENRLIEASRFDGVNWVVTDTFAYGPLGRRIRHSDLIAPTSDVDFYYEGDNVVAEFDPAGDTLLRYYVNGTLYLDERVLMNNGTADRYYLLQEMFTVAGLTGQAGNPTELYSYDAYGEVSLYNGSGAPIAQSTFGNPYFFTGRRLDLFKAPPPFQEGEEEEEIPTPSLPPPVLLYHYRARAYDAVHGRFMQRDPGGYSDGMNLFESFRSNPAKYVDPHGQLAEDFMDQAMAWIRDHLTTGKSSNSDPVVAHVEDTCHQVNFAMQQLLDKFKKLPPVQLAIECKCAVDTPEERSRLIANGKKETYYTLVAISMRVSASNPYFRFHPDGQVLYRQLYGYDVQEIRLLNAAGDLQGAANSLHGAFVDFPIDMANLELALMGIEDIHIPNPNWARGQFLETSDGVDSFTRGVGGGAILELMTAGVCGLLPAAGGAEPIFFGQKRIGLIFSNERLAHPLVRNRPVLDVAKFLEKGFLNADDIVIQVFRDPRTGKLVSVNSRGLGALSEAGLRPSNIELVFPGKKLLRRLKEPPLLPGGELPSRFIHMTETRKCPIIIHTIEIPK